MDYIENYFNDNIDQFTGFNLPDSIKDAAKMVFPLLLSLIFQSWKDFLIFSIAVIMLYFGFEYYSNL